MDPLAGLPPLPSSWPFAPRGPSAAPVASRTVLPGLDGVWHLEAAAGLDLSAPPAALGGAFGRGGVFRCGEVVLRPYRRGGLVRHVNERIYAGPGRFRRECQVHRALWDAGLPTVEPLGWAFRPRLWGCEGVYLTRFTAGAPWPRAWDAAGLDQVRAILDALCAWGLYAPDLNATNFLVEPGGHVLALDWDRALWTPGVPLLERYRQRLARSLRKLGAPPEIVI
jgi:hypothetical protein